MAPQKNTRGDKIGPGNSTAPESNEEANVISDKDNRQNPEDMPSMADLSRRELGNELANRDKAADQNAGTSNHQAVGQKS